MKLSKQQSNKCPIKSFCSYFLPLILVFQLSLPGIALCFGINGHVALENYSDGLCNEVITESASRNPSKFSTQNIDDSNNQHCGPCVDIRISDDNSEIKLTSSKGLIPEIDIYAFVAYVLSSPMLEETSIKKTLIQESPKTLPSLDSLLTTILIC